MLWSVRNEQMTLMEFTDKVHNELETFDYPEMVDMFAEENVAKSMSTVIVDSYRRGLSYRMCAVIIWSMTMNYQVMQGTRH